MTARAAALWLLTTSITSVALAAISVAISWSVASRCTRALKSLRARLATPPSDARLAKVEADQAELFSSLSSVTTTVKRLSSRAGMQEVRARAAPPAGASKAELRRFYQVEGLTGPEIAARQLKLKETN